MIVDELPEAAYVDRLFGAAISTGDNDRPFLRDQLRDAAGCHFDATGWPSLIRLHIMRGEAIAPTGHRGRIGNRENQGLMSFFTPPPRPFKKTCSVPIFPPIFPLGNSSLLFPDRKRGLSKLSPELERYAKRAPWSSLSDSEGCSKASQLLRLLGDSIHASS